MSAPRIPATPEPSRSARAADGDRHEGRAVPAGSPAPTGRVAANGWPRKVSDIMRRELVSILPDASVRDLIRSLRDHGIGGMPVVDESGNVLGTVSSTDLLWLATTELPDAPGFLAVDTLFGRTVREIMTPDVFGVPPDASLPELRRFFARTGVHRALVLDDGAIVGIVALSDVLDTLLDAAPAEEDSC
jgi:CBS domain-containing protein